MTNPVAIGAAVGGQIGAAALGASAAKRAAHQRQRGNQQATIAVQGGVDQALASINAPIDQSLSMNRPYSDAGIGAMANVNAMLGIPASQGTAQDVSHYESQLDKLKSKQKGYRDEINDIQGLLNGTGGWNKGGYRMGGKYKGMHRDQLSNRLESLQNKVKATGDAYQGLNRTYQEAVRQNGLITAANQAATTNGVQPIKPFEFSGANFNQDPSYQFRLDQGLEALDRRYAARGGIGSGARLMGITDYAQGLASTEYQNAFDRSMNEWRSQFDVLNANLAVAGRGQQAVGTNIGVLNQAGVNSANTIMSGASQIAGLYGEAGNAAASGTLGQYNALQQGIGQMAYLGGNAGWFDSDSAPPPATQPTSHIPGNDGLLD